MASSKGIVTTALWPSSSIVFLFLRKSSQRSIARFITQSIKAPILRRLYLISCRKVSKGINSEAPNAFFHSVPTTDTHNF